MELLFILPWLLGLGLYEIFRADSSSDDSPNDNPADSSGNDTVASGDELIVGAGNAETISGRSGDDFILGGANADTINGGGDDDVLVGEAGADDIFGGQGYDTLLGAAGDDDLYGGDGNDLLMGGAGNDSMEGGNGADTLTGISGADTLEGGAGDDVLDALDGGDRGGLQFFSNLATHVQSTYGSAADADALSRLNSGLTNAEPAATDDDIVFAGSGNDFIAADYSDTVTGGLGNDLIRVSPDGPGEAVVINDFDPAQDTLQIFVPFGTNTTLSYVDGATPADGVSLTLASGDVLAVLKNTVAANLPNGLVEFIEV